MAKAEAAKQNDKPQQSPASSAPQGYQQETTDVVGFWDGDKGQPIHCVPQFVNLSDSGIDKNKPSALIFVRLIDACKVQSSEGEGKMEERETVEAKPGDMVGIWFSSGMRDILMSAGRPTYMIQSGAKDVGKPSPMKVYKVMHPKGSKAERLKVRDDRRQQSALSSAAPFAGPKKPTDSGDASGADDIPF